MIKPLFFFFLFVIFLVSTAQVLAQDVLVWQGQYFEGSKFMQGTYNFTFTVQDGQFTGNVCYKNQTTITTGNWGQWKSEQHGVATFCNDSSKSYFLFIEIEGKEQNPPRRLTSLNYLRSDFGGTVYNDLDIKGYISRGGSPVNVKGGINIYSKKNSSLSTLNIYQNSSSKGAAATVRLTNNKNEKMLLSLPSPSSIEAPGLYYLASGALSFTLGPFAEQFIWQVTKNEQYYPLATLDQDKLHSHVNISTNQSIYAQKDICAGSKCLSKIDFKDTNETVRLNRLTSSFCTNDQFIVGIHINGTPVCSLFSPTILDQEINTTNSPVFRSLSIKNGLQINGSFTINGYPFVENLHSSCPPNQKMIGIYQNGSIKCKSIVSKNIFDQDLNTTNSVTFSALNISNDLTIKGSIKTSAGCPIPHNHFWAEERGRIRSTGNLKGLQFSFGDGITGTFGMPQPCDGTIKLIQVSGKNVRNGNGRIDLVVNGAKKSSCFIQTPKERNKPLQKICDLAFSAGDLITPRTTKTPSGNNNGFIISWIVDYN